MNPKLKILNPFDYSEIDEINFNTEIEVDIALNTAVQCFHNIKYNDSFPKYKRIEVLEKIIRKIEDEFDEIAILAAKEGGKPITDSRAEISRAINGIKIAISYLMNENAGTIPMELNPASNNRIAFNRKEPIGVIFGITAFNHPFNLIIHMVVPAIAAGSPIIIKPDLRTPLSALKFREISLECGLSEDFFQILIIDNIFAEKIVRDNRINYLSFIGSAKVGWYLRSIVSAGVRVGLEHGGIAPVIINDNSVSDEWINSLTKGAFYHSGQVCVSIQRIFINKSLCDEFLDKFTIASQNFRIGDQLLPETEGGPIIRTSELERINNWVQEAIGEGAKLITGGMALPDYPQSCYTPTILHNPDVNSKVSQLEIFGPVVSVYEYDNVEDAMLQANNTNFHFQASVYTKEIDKAISIASKLSAQNVMINDHTAFRTDWMPFGGINQSGLGLGGIPYSIEEYSINKMYVIKTNI